MLDVTNLPATEVSPLYQVSNLRMRGLWHHRPHGFFFLLHSFIQINKSETLGIHIKSLKSYQVLQPFWSSSAGLFFRQENVLALLLLEGQYGVWACEGVGTHTHLQACGGQRSMSGVFLNYSPLYWEGSLTELGRHQCSKTGWPVTGFFPSLPFQCWDFYVGTKRRPPWFSHWSIFPALGMGLFKSVLIKFEYIQVQLSRTPAVTR